MIPSPATFNALQDELSEVGFDNPDAEYTQAMEYALMEYHEFLNPNEY